MMRRLLLMRYVELTNKRSLFMLSCRVRPTSCGTLQHNRNGLLRMNDIYANYDSISSPFSTKDRMR